MLFIADAGLLPVAKSGLAGVATSGLLSDRDGELPPAADGAVAAKEAETSGAVWPFDAATAGCSLAGCPGVGKASKGAGYHFVSGPGPQAVFGLSLEPA